MSKKTARHTPGRRVYSALIIIAIILGAALYRYGFSGFIEIPTIMSGTPETEARVISPEGAFVIQFSQKMNKASVEESYQISPLIAHHILWDKNMMIIKPSKILKTGDHYQVSIGQNSRGYFGKVLEKTYYLNFIVGGNPQVLQVFPEEEDIQPRQKIIILFSHDMVREDQIGLKIQPEFIRIAPSVKGQWKWYNPKTLVFVPGDQFAPSTRYHLQSTQPLTTAGSAKINDHIDQTFQTPRVAVISPLVTDHHKSISVTEPFLVSFNQAITPKVLEKNITIRNQKGKSEQNIQVSLANADEHTYAIRRKNLPWEYNEIYTLEVSENLLPPESNLSLGQTQEFQFTTEDIIKVLAPMEEATGSYLINPESSGFSFETKEKFNENILAGAIQFIPEIKYQLVMNSEYEYRITFSTSSQKKENTELYFSEKINSDKTKYINQPIKIILKKAPELKLEANTIDQKICISSNNDLIVHELRLYSQEQLMKNMELLSIEDEDESICPSSNLANHRYYLPQSNFRPNSTHELTAKVKDIYDQESSVQILVPIRNTTPDEYSLQKVSDEFYHYTNHPEEIKFEFQSKNIEQLTIHACRISPLQAIKIEGTYNRRWQSFIPSNNNCQQYKAINQKYDQDWGETSLHQIALEDLFDQIEPGLYYIWAVAYAARDADGQILEVNDLWQYSPWNILSKRGESALVWLVDAENHRPISDATIKFYSNDSSLLQTTKTDQDGIYFLKDNRLKYEYVTAQKNDQEMLISVFSGQGFEASQYGVPFNADENQYRYQLFLEEFEKSSSKLRGVFILKDVHSTSQKIKEITKATVSLYNTSEELLGRQLAEIDAYGNINFDIKPQYPLLDGQYYFSVCIGLHQGICHGENLWVSFYKGEPPAREDDTPTTPKTPPLPNPYITIDTNQILIPGEIITIQLAELIPKQATLVTLERDSIYHHQVFYPDQATAKLQFTLTSEMIPEVMISVTQFQEASGYYQLRRIILDERVKQSDGMTDYSVIDFELSPGNNQDYSDILQTFYPMRGTSIITAATLPSLEHQINSLSSFGLYSPENISELVLVDGSIHPILREQHAPFNDLEITNPDSTHLLIAHDRFGNFQKRHLKKELPREEYSIDISAPPFVRPRDEIILEVSINNHSTLHKNVQLKSQATGLQFISNSESFLGLMANQERKINVATRVPDLLSGENISLSFWLEEQEKKIVEQKISIPVARAPQIYRPPLAILNEIRESSEKIVSPINQSGLYQRKTIISTTPISFVLENLRQELNKERLWFKDKLTQTAVAANYWRFFEPELSDVQKDNQLSDLRESIGYQLQYLQARQNPDGGWSDNFVQLGSNPLFTIQIVKALTVLEQFSTEIPGQMKRGYIDYLKEQLNIHANRRTREGLSHDALEASEITLELRLLNALSSSTPSGVNYANNWYAYRETLDHTALVLLLLTLEDYRDAQVSGMNYKIEELIQLLKDRRHLQGGLVHLDSHQGASNDLTITSWYLEALVRQASARTDIPPVITWLVQNKYSTQNQSSFAQTEFLHAMAAYLRVFREELTAKELTIHPSNSAPKTFLIDAQKQYQTFSVTDLLDVDIERDNYPEISIQTDQVQSLFTEVQWINLTPINVSISNGLSIYVQIDDGQTFQVGEKISGSLSIISPQTHSNVMVIQPQISGVRQTNILSVDDFWKLKSISKEEKWYIFDRLTAGETIIPFEWQLNHAGKFSIPPVSILVAEQPEINAQSKADQIEIRN